MPSFWRRGGWGTVENNTSGLHQLAMRMHWGNPPPNSVKFFATLEVLEQAKDRTWLAKVTNALNQHWQNKNAAKRKESAGSLGERSVVGGCAVSPVARN